MKIIKASDIIESKIQKLLEKSQKLSKAGLTPKLSVILVGANPASLLYVKNKEKFCHRIGAEFDLVRLEDSITQKEFLKKIKDINNDPMVTGCFVQLPVPEKLKDIDITQLINPQKDVDGFHLNNINKIYTGDLSGLISCTPKGIITLLKENDITISGKHVVIIGRSYIVGRPLSLLFQAYDATVTLCHSKTKDIKSHTKAADIIVSAVGKAAYFDSTYINPDKKQILIDVGINKLEGKTVGDFLYEDLKEKVYAITPVPGGVGPMTVFSLMENLLQATDYLIQRKKEQNENITL